jgi:diadenosine tetraphosphate (Ap4A) HIT family hydrolase
MLKWIKKKLSIFSIENKLETINNRLCLIERLVQVGVDINFKTPSWIVVCLKGKNQDIVRFFELPDNDIARLFEELKFLEKQYHIHPVLDAPLYIKKEYLKL